MFRLIATFDELDIAQLQSVYEESIQINGLQHYPCESEYMKILLAKQDFYSDVVSEIRKYGCKYVVWVADGAYVAAAKLEKYSDGYLLTGLETAPGARRKGYATKLVCEILKNAHIIGIDRLYSHVRRVNLPSAGVHMKCGFNKVSDRAVLLDGSVSSAYDTYLYEIEPRL